MSEIPLKIAVRVGRFVIISFLLLMCANYNPAQTKITGMRAMLFYQETGKFSEDVFTTPSDLWNVAFDGVYSTFVVVEVEGDDKTNKSDRPRKLDFSARYIPFEGSKRAILVRKSSPLWFFADRGKSKLFLGFWIDNVGCDPVQLSANIRGQKTRFRKTINFGCGE